MPKYYYDCPIKALFMMKEFGVKIKQLDNYPKLPQEFVDISFKDMRDDVSPYFNPRFEKENRLYVCEESEHIFEAREGDFGHKITLCDAGFSAGIFDGERWYCKNGREDGLKIIMRDNKHFFMPEVEND